LIRGQGVVLENIELLAQPSKRLAARAGGYDQIRTQRRDSCDDQANRREQEGDHTGQELEHGSHCRNDRDESTKGAAQATDDRAEYHQRNPTGQHRRYDFQDCYDDFTIGLNPHADLRRHIGNCLGQLLEDRRKGCAHAEDAHLDDLPKGIERVGEVLSRLGIFAAHGQAESAGLLLKCLDARSALGHHGQKLRTGPAEQGLRQRRLAGRVFDATDRLRQELELLFRREAFEVLVLQSEVSKRIGLRAQPTPGVIDTALHPAKAGLEGLNGGARLTGDELQLTERFDAQAGPLGHLRDLIAHRTERLGRS